MRHVLSLVFAVLWLALSPESADAQDFEKGLAAARAGDFAAAVSEWRPLAEDGHIEAQFNLGAVYEAGQGVPEDPAEAAGWYALAAGQGHARAQYNLGVMYADGRGVPRDDARAATWMRKAAEQDHAKAQYNLGVLYRAGRGVPKDSVQARIWFDRAAANGVAAVPAEGREPSPQSTSRPIDLRSGFPGVESAEPKPAVPVEAIEPDSGGTLLEPEAASVAVESIGLNLYQVDDTGPPARAEPRESEPESPSAPEPQVGPDIASVPQGPLRITANMPDGARYRIEVTETRERVRDGGFVMAQTSELGVDMVVKSESGAGALIEWSFGPATVNSAGDPQAGRLASQLGKLIDGQKITYHINRNGNVTTLGNPAQLTSFYEKSIDRVVDALKTQTADPQLIDDIRTNLAPLLSEDYAAERALELPRLLHFFAGLELAAGETYSRDGVMNLPPSIEALPSTVAYELKWFDRTAGVAWLRWSQSVDPIRAADAVKAYIETLVAETGQPMPEEYDLGAIDVSDSADYEIDLATGFPKQVIYTRNVELFGFSQTEKRRIRVLR
jgi:hypothetical protein